MSEELKTWKPKRKGNYMVKVIRAEQNMYFDAPVVVFRCLECEYTDKVIGDKFSYKFCPNCGSSLLDEVQE